MQRQNFTKDIFEGVSVVVKETQKGKQNVYKFEKNEYFELKITISENEVSILEIV